MHHPVSEAGSADGPTVPMVVIIADVLDDDPRHGRVSIELRETFVDPTGGRWMLGTHAYDVQSTDASMDPLEWVTDESIRRVAIDVLELSSADDPSGLTDEYLAWLDGRLRDLGSEHRVLEASVPPRAIVVIGDDLAARLSARP